MRLQCLVETLGNFKFAWFNYCSVHPRPPTATMARGNKHASTKPELDKNEIFSTLWGINYHIFISLIPSKMSFITYNSNL